MNHAIHWSWQLGLAMALGLVASASGQSFEDRFEDLAREKLNLDRYELQNLIIPANDREATEVSIELNGETLTLELLPSSDRAPGFRVVTIDRLNRRHQPALPPETTYRGQVRGKAGSRVAASIINGGLRAQIYTDDGQWGVQPAFELDDQAGLQVHVVYRAQDIIPGDYACGVDHKEPREFEHVPPQAGAAFGGSCGNVAEIAYDADVEFYILNGSSINNTVADIESINNAVNLIYEADVDITHIITEIRIWTSEVDPYTSTDSSTLLKEIRT
jgi:hypothetical protein